MTDYEINGKDYIVRYDLDNRITKVTTTSAVSYRYDALGRRVIRKEGSAKSALIWWGNSENAEHKHQAGQTVIQNDIMSHPTRLNAVIARAVTGSKTSLQWYHKNYLDHVYTVSNKRGKLREHYRYTAFGEVTIYDDNGGVQTESQIENTIMWNTRRRDTVTGFYLYKYRHYSPELGRWPSRDPIEEKGGINLYGFCYNSPQKWWDTLGSYPESPPLSAFPFVDWNMGLRHPPRRNDHIPDMNPANAAERAKEKIRRRYRQGPQAPYLTRVPFTDSTATVITSDSKIIEGLDICDLSPGQSKKIFKEVVLMDIGPATLWLGRFDGLLEGTITRTKKGWRIEGTVDAAATKLYDFGPELPWWLQQFNPFAFEVSPARGKIRYYNKGMCPRTSYTPPSNDPVYSDWMPSPRPWIIPEYDECEYQKGKIKEQQEGR